MEREKKLVYKVQKTEGKCIMIRQGLKEYDIEFTQDIWDALKDLLGGTIKEGENRKVVTLKVKESLAAVKTVATDLRLR